MNSYDIEMQHVMVGDRMEAFVTPLYGTTRCERLWLPVVAVRVDHDGLVVAELSNGHGLKQTVLRSPETRVRIAAPKPALRLVA